MTDEELLKRELNWIQPARRADLKWSPRPPGRNVMNAFGALLFLVGLGLASRTWNVPGASELGNLLRAILSSTAAWIFAVWASRRLWILIGPVGRAVLRPVGALGGSVALFMVVLAGLVAAALLLAPLHAVASKFDELRAPKSDEQRAPPKYVSGPREAAEFAVLSAPDGGLVEAAVEEGRALCAARGPGWRLPRKKDGPFLTENVRISEVRFGAALLAEEEDTGGQMMGKFTWNPSTEALQAGFVPNPGELPRFRGKVVCVNR